jgi:hypothetical protein
MTHTNLHMETTTKKMQHAAHFQAYPSRHESKDKWFADTWRACAQSGLVYLNCPIIIYHIIAPITHTATVKRITHLSPNSVALHLEPLSRACPLRLIASRYCEYLPIPFQSLKEVTNPDDSLYEAEIEDMQEKRKQAVGIAERQHTFQVSIQKR